MLRKQATNQPAMQQKTRRRGPHFETVSNEEDKRERGGGLGPLASSFLGVVLTLSAIAVGLSVLRYRRNNRDTLDDVGRRSWNTCQSQLCLAHFRRLRDSLNRSTSPCDDFYRFACGAWQPRVSAAQTALRDLLDVAQLDFIRYLETPATSAMTSYDQEGMAAILPNGRATALPNGHPGHQRNRAERAYHFCLQRGGDVAADVVMLREFLANRSLSWPDRATSAPTAHEPLDVLLDLELNWNLGLWFTVRISPPLAQATPRSKVARRLLRISRGIVSSGWKKALDATVSRREYKARVRRFYDALRTNNFVAISDKDVEDLRRDESAIANALSDSANGGQIEMAFPLKQIQKLATPHLTTAQWLTLLNWHLRKHSGIRLTDADSVLATNVRLLQAVDNLLGFFSADTLLYQFAWCLVQLLGWMVDPALPGRPVAKTQSPAENRRADCFWAAQRAFGLAILSGYVLVNYPASVHSAVDNILMTVTQTAIDLFVKSPWIDRESRAAAVDKLRRVNITLWPPDAYLNESVVDGVLKQFPEPGGAGVTMLRYWLDVLKVRRSLIGMKSRQRGTEEDAFLFYSEDTQSQQQALFRYHYFPNMLAVSLHGLRSPLFVEGGGRAVNMGALGAQYAAALSRAFDPRGVLVDGRGSTSALWWGKASYQEYERRAVCHAAGADRVDSFFEGLAAVEIAYAAFNATRSISEGNIRRGLLKRRPQTFLGLSEDQAFFVSFCQASCAREPTDRQRMSCTLPLKNFPVFAAAFTCPVASAMNPSKRCRFFEGTRPEHVAVTAASLRPLVPTTRHK
ncbi:hypothetical protein HPB51_007936 [Rhipicephalus microplus]|uniref:M13 family peptidase n=1 Tax=Rhipicephalus microplus TaxID=6941 RepID=A0A9J6ENG6_RHIMP|nr:endothelin-converting enzyme 2-like [Rhipicephalus microplus]KAH8035692.1 hypothetical protein HPB51_007936 [Rhipicephalus microplus]